MELGEGGGGEGGAVEGAFAVLGGGEAAGGDWGGRGRLVGGVGWGGGGGGRIVQMSLSAGVAEAMLRDSWWMWEGWRRICLVQDGGQRGCVEGFGVGCLREMWPS